MVNMVGTSSKKQSAILPRLMGVREAAQYLSISAWTVRDWVKAGLLRPVALPGSIRRARGGRVVARPEDYILNRVLIDRRDLDALIELGREQ